MTKFELGDIVKAGGEGVFYEIKEFEMGKGKIIQKDENPDIPWMDSEAIYLIDFTMKRDVIESSTNHYTKRDEDIAWFDEYNIQPSCPHSVVVYHDKKEKYICPFCI